MSKTLKCLGAAGLADIEVLECVVLELREATPEESALKHTTYTTGISHTRFDDSDNEFPFE